MSELDSPEDEGLEDEIAGLRDAVEIADWPAAMQLALGLRGPAAAAGWPIIDQLADSMCRTLQPESSEAVPEEVIEVLADTMEMCILRGLRTADDLDPELATALRQMKGKFDV